MTETAPPADQPATIDAPIVAVTVFADRARVTRRGRIEPPVGAARVVFDGLPLTLHPDSVRVSGAGRASVLGVDVDLRHRARPADEALAGLERELREARAVVLGLEDADAVAALRLEFLAELARRSSRSYAAALPAGQTDPDRIAQLCDALDAQQAEVRRHRREQAERRREANDHASALERALAARRGPAKPDHAEPDHYAAAVILDVQGPGGLDLELSYVVDGAAWRSAYDVRVAGDALSLSWFGLVNQSTGEDWPECELRLSTARPARAAAVPELRPWFLDRVRAPAPRAMAAPMRAGVAYARPESLGFDGGNAEEARLRDVVAVPEQGATAATYRPQRAVAIPADGDAHRTTVAVIALAAKRDYVTAPVLAEEAQLRVTVINTSAHTLPAGTAAVFHAEEAGGADPREVFVGSSVLDLWAPGEEIELALGVDDRIRVERTLVRRTATKAVLGTTRRREAQHRITVTNHTPDLAKITVLDQVPVSRDEAVTVKEVRVEPAPAERTDLGELTWVVELGPGEKRELHIGVRVEVARGVELAGWRE